MASTIFSAMLLGIAPFLLGSDSRVQVSIPADFPIQLTLRETGRAYRIPLLGADSVSRMFELDVENRSDKAILLLVVKKLSATAGGNPLIVANPVNTSWFYFQPYAREAERIIEPGEVRTVLYGVGSGGGLGANHILIPFSVLFEDGTSVGVREPFAYQYTQQLQTSLDGYVEKEEPEAASQIQRGRQIISAILWWNQKLEMEALMKSLEVSPQKTAEP